MSKAKKFIQDCTRNCSNEIVCGICEPWLTPDEAIRAVEIVKEEMMEKAIEGKVLANGMGNPILHLWDKGRGLIDKKVKVIVIEED